ncbi:MAG: Holliday junction resolvase RuvX [Betaproteobacteria bacterium]|jgi:putative Holliday junction resolvase|nr:Holliday junction resolvase RuvX [Betaproteobacteria bacterium]
MGAGTVLAFDFGTKRLGVAVGETALRLAHPLALIATEQTEARFAAVARLLAEWQPGQLVVGLPLAEDGTPQESTRRARRFANQLEGRYRLPVALVDERYTTADAESGLRAAGGRRAVSRKQADSAAAQLILQQWFDETRLSADK